MTRPRKLSLLLVLIAVLLLGSCRAAPESSTPIDEPDISQTTQPLYPGPDQTGVAPSQTQAGDEGSYPIIQVTSSPQPAGAATSTETVSGYPQPQATNTPAFVTPTVSPQSAKTAYPGPVSTATPETVLPSQTPTQPADAGGTATPSSTGEAIITLTPPPTEYIGQPVLSPPAPGSVVTIWHSWNEAQTQMLEIIIASFQDSYPDISFDVLTIPKDELRARYEEASYYGGGPGLLLAPAEWGPAYQESGLVVDLSPYTSPEFLSTINPVALETGQYHGEQISLPFGARGVLLYRNQEIIPQASASYEELVAAAQAATQGGRVGAFFELGSFFSSAHLYGVGGHLVDEDGNPTFNNQMGLNWISLLMDFELAGPAEINTNRDLTLFKDGKVGMIVEGSWNIQTLADAVGPENLVIDPWPAYGDGSLSGYVQADSIFLNTNVTENNRSTALLFAGYLLTQDAQMRLAEIGFIPTVTTTIPRNIHVQQAMAALMSGSAYPRLPAEQYYNIYWSALDSAIYNITQLEIEPTEALQSAYDYIVTRLDEINGGG